MRSTHESHENTFVLNVWHKTQWDLNKTQDQAQWDLNKAQDQAQWDLHMCLIKPHFYIECITHNKAQWDLNKTQDKA